VGHPWSGGSALRDVVVWRGELLPATETFIADQAAALRRWRPLLAGIHRVPDGLEVEPALVLTGRGPLGRWQRRRLAETHHDPRLARLLRSPGTGLVHAHFGPDGLFVASEAARTQCPLAVTFHGWDATRLPDDPARGTRYRHRLAALFEQADALVAVSDFIAARLLALGAPAEKVHRLYTGIPLPEHSGPAPTALARRILFVGRLIDVKGPGDLLEAVAGLPGEHRGTPVRLYGDGHLRPALEARARALGVDAVFMGHRPPAEVHADLARGGIFAGPSRRTAAGAVEGLGTVFLEAAAHGLAVAAYRSGGVPEAVADGVTGLLAPEGDVPALSRALCALLDDPQLARRLGSAGRARVEQRFDIRHRTAELEALYDVLARPRTAPRSSATTGTTPPVAVVDPAMSGPPPSG
jgi:glycosyltransferase involved in cell wall biosynthesis